MTKVITADIVRQIVSEMRLPRLELYGGDWLKDEVSSCSLAAQGLWFRMLLAMHDAKPYGHLADAAGRPLPDAVIVKRCGASGVKEYRKLIQELRDAGTPGSSGDSAYLSAALRSAEINEATIDLTPLFLSSPGVIYSRRLLRDQRLRIIRKLAGKPSLLSGFASTNMDILPMQTPTQNAGTRAGACDDSDNGVGEDLFSITREFDSFWKDLLRARVPKPVHKDAARKAFFVRITSADLVLRLGIALANYRGSERVTRGFVADADTWLRDWESWEAYQDRAAGPRLVPRRWTIDDTRELKWQLTQPDWSRTDCSREEAEAYLSHVRTDFDGRADEAPSPTEWLASRKETA